MKSSHYLSTGGILAPAMIRLNTSIVIQTVKHQYKNNFTSCVNGKNSTNREYWQFTITIPTELNNQSGVTIYWSTTIVQQHTFLALTMLAVTFISFRACLVFLSADFRAFVEASIVFLSFCEACFFCEKYFLALAWADKPISMSMATGLSHSSSKRSLK